MVVLESFSKDLRAARKRQHLSQQELAEKLGVTRRTVQGWESGQITEPHPKHLRKIIWFLDMFGERESA